MFHGISVTVEKTVLNLEDLNDKGLDYAIGSYLAKFFIKDEDGLTTVISHYTKASHEKRKLENREYIKTEIDFKFDLKLTLPLIKSHSIQPCLLDQFSSRFLNCTHQKQTWLI